MRQPTASRPRLTALTMVVAAVFGMTDQRIARRAYAVLRNFAVVGLGLVAGFSGASAATGPTQGIWSAIAPGIDGPKAVHHTIFNFWVVGAKVEHFGGSNPPLAGGVVATLAGVSFCSALVEYPSATIHGNSFSNTLTLPGGKLVLKGKFTSASAAHGTWEETGPCFIRDVAWTAKAGGKAPAGVSPGTGAPEQSAGGTCSPKPCGNDDGLIVYVPAVDRNAIGPEGERELYLRVRVVNTNSAFTFQPNSLDFGMKFADGKVNGWPANDAAVKLSSGVTVNCRWFPGSVQAPPLPKGSSFSGNVCFAGLPREFAGSLSLTFDDPADGNANIVFPLRWGNPK